MKFSNTDFRSIISADDVLPDILRATGNDNVIEYFLAPPEQSSWYKVAKKLSKISNSEETFIKHALSEIGRIINVSFVEVDELDKALITFLKVEKYAPREKGTLGLIGYKRGWDKTDISWKNMLGDDISGSEKETLLHEICHGLGLDHPNGNGDARQFNTDITVMSYNDGDLPYKGKLRDLDILALQKAWNVETEQEFVHRNDPTIDINKYTVIEAFGNTTLFQDSDGFAFVLQDDYDQPIRTDYLDQFVKLDGSHHEDWAGYKLLAAERIGNQNRLLWSYLSEGGVPSEYVVTTEGMLNEAGNSIWYSASFDEYMPDSSRFRPIASEFGIDPLSGIPIEERQDTSTPTNNPVTAPMQEQKPEDYERSETINNIKGTKMNDRLYGTQEPDILLGKNGHDILNGDKGDDVLLGGKGDDFLRGAQGNDYLDGSHGADTLIGGKGADVFQISKGIDYVEDFSIKQGDRIALDKKGQYSIIYDRKGVYIAATNRKQLFLDGVNYVDALLAGVDLFVQPI